MHPEQIPLIIEAVIKNNTGIISIFFGLIFMGIWKDSISSVAAGIQFRLSAAYPGEDDIIIILIGTKCVKARLQKIGIRTSSFYIYATDSKLVVPNIKLKDLYIQKVLLRTKKQKKAS